MEHAFGLDIPLTLEEVCDRRRMALIVHDMQVGIVGQIDDAEEITSAVVTVLDAARRAGVRVFFTRHMSLPNEIAGASQLRTAMAWQRVDNVAQVKPAFPATPPNSSSSRKSPLVRPKPSSTRWRCRPSSAPRWRWRFETAVSRHSPSSVWRSRSASNRPSVTRPISAFCQ